MTFYSWPTWALGWLRSVLEWTGLFPMMLLEVYVEMARRDPPPAPPSDLSIGMWCPAAVGVA